jgi:hypothetical protein
MPANGFHGVKREGQQLKMNLCSGCCLARLEGDLKTAGLVQVESQRPCTIFFVAELMERLERTGRSGLHLDRQDFFICSDHIVHFRVFGFSLAEPVVERWLARIVERQMLPDEFQPPGQDR